MRWPIVCAGLFGASVLVLAQPLFTADDLDDSMKGVGRQFELVNWAVSAGDYEGAKVRVTRAREQLSATIITCLALRAFKVSVMVALDTHRLRLFGFASTGSQ